VTTVIVPYVHGKLHPDTLRAVQYSGFYCRFVDLDPLDLGGYGRLIRGLWRSQVTVIICEHDVVPTRDQLSTLHDCDHDWCSYSYDGDLYPGGPMFGLVRLSGRLMANHPHAAEVALITGKRKDLEAVWWQVDALMARDLKIRGVEWHQHAPVVHHAHTGPPSGQ
jgi:hypothetical protein